MQTVQMITDRLDINIGTFCNQKCCFCYYSGALDEPYESLSKITAILRRYRSCGIRKLHITGGEPLLHKDIFSITARAHDLGFDHISIITNGVALNSDVFFRLKNNHVDEFVVSLHGASAATHNALTGGAFYDSALEAVKLLKNNDFPFSVNFVVNAKNFIEIVRFAEMIAAYRPRLVTFLFFNPTQGNRRSNDELIPDICASSKELELAGAVLDKAKVAWDFKFIPICASSANAQHCNNQAQAIFDFEEWNYKTDLLLSFGGAIKYIYALLRWYQDFDYAQIRTISYSILSYLCALRYRQFRNFTYLNGCRSCSYRLICFGVNKCYVTNACPNPIAPMFGEPILDPLEPRGNRSPKACRLDYVKNILLYTLSNLLFWPFKTRYR